MPKRENSKLYSDFRIVVSSIKYSNMSMNNLMADISINIVKNWTIPIIFICIRYPKYTILIRTNLFSEK